MQVESAAQPQLKGTRIDLRQNRDEESSASVAAIRIAASPPYSSSVRKIKVSETEMCELNCGILITIRELRNSVNTAINKKRRSSTRRSNQYADKKYTAPPPRIVAQMYVWVSFL